MRPKWLLDTAYGKWFNLAVPVHALQLTTRQDSIPQSWAIHFGGVNRAVSHTGPEPLRVEDYWMKIDPTCAVRNDCNATRSPVRLHHVTMPTERLLQVIERQLGDLVPQADPLAVT